MKKKDEDFFKLSPLLNRNDAKSRRDAFKKGFDAGYEKAASDYGGQGWLIPPSEPEAWREYNNPKKPKKEKINPDDHVAF